MTLPEPRSRYVKIALGFIGAVLVANVLLLDFFFVVQRNSLLDFQTRLTQLADSFKILGGRLYTTASGEQKIVPVAEQSNTCPVACLDLISLATATAKVPSRSLVTPVFQTSTNTTVSSNKGEFFVPMGSGSIIQTNNWTNIDSAQAAFDAGNYGSIKQAYFEAFLRVQSGEVHARLFDSTTPAIFFGSDVKTGANSATFLSAPITLSSGTKTYKVQMYSTITTGYLDQARIRIVTQ